jgi:hypothetical protein
MADEGATCTAELGRTGRIACAANAAGVPLAVAALLLRGAYGNLSVAMTVVAAVLLIGAAVLALIHLPIERRGARDLRLAIAGSAIASLALAGRMLLTLPVLLGCPLIASLFLRAEGSRATKLRAAVVRFAIVAAAMIWSSSLAARMGNVQALDFLSEAIVVLFCPAAIAAAIVLSMLAARAGVRPIRAIVIAFLPLPLGPFASEALPAVMAVVVCPLLVPVSLFFLVRAARSRARPRWAVAATIVALALGVLLLILAVAFWIFISSLQHSGM